MRRFGGDPSVVGETVSMDGRPRLVAGVAPAAFRRPCIRPPYRRWSARSGHARRRSVPGFDPDCREASGDVVLAPARPCAIRACPP